MKVTKDQYKTGEHSLTAKEAKKLVDTCEDFTEKMLLKTALVTGIRRNDISKLSWNNIDWEERSITFYESKKRRTHKVYINDEFLAELKQLKSTQDKEYYLFPGRSEQRYGKGHISSRSCYDVLQRNLERAGLRKRPFHSLRATCVKLCQEKGWSVEQSAKHIGDTVSVVQRHYTTPSIDEMRLVASEKGFL